MKTVAFYDTKPYDREYFERNPDSGRLKWQFHDFRLSAQTVASARGADAVCVFVNDRPDAGCLEALRGLGVGLIALRCAGFNNVDLAAARRLGMRVVRVPAYSPHAVAEHTVGLLLTLNRKIHRAYNRVREYNFSLSGLVGFDLFGKTVGVVGTGRIGRIAAQIFRGFGSKVMAYDPMPQQEWAVEHGVTYADLDTVLAAADILTLHLPLTPETHHLLGERNLERMKPGAFIVNTSRGKLIDSAALIRHLKSGHIGGVALDVYEEEEGVFFEDHSGSMMQDDELALLISFPNVLITSHQAFLTHEALTEIARVTTDNLVRWDAGSGLAEETVVV